MISEMWDLLSGFPISCDMQAEISTDPSRYR